MFAYSVARIRRWKPQLGHTLRLRTNFSRRSVCPHASHFSHASGGISCFSCRGRRGFFSFLNHAMRAIYASVAQFAAASFAWFLLSRRLVGRGVLFAATLAWSEPLTALLRFAQSRVSSSHSLCKAATKTLALLPTRIWGYRDVGRRLNFALTC